VPDLQNTIRFETASSIEGKSVKFKRILSTEPFIYASESENIAPNNVFW
jgi:hypothetical protein